MLELIDFCSNLFLSQKERDLELAARIGQTLLSQNKSLKSKNDELKSELASCNETVSHHHSISRSSFVLITLVYHLPF